MSTGLIATIVVAGIVGALVLFVASRPAAFTVTREGRFNAPASTVFEQVNDFHRWEAWSPWEKLDLNLKRTYSGPSAGVGASYAWAGDRNVGEGRMTIEESRPNERIRIKLEFLKPFAATNTAEFVFQPEGAGTKVTWTMTGKNKFVAKAIGLVMNMDTMIGGMFEQGLSQLKRIVEG